MEVRRKESILRYMEIDGMSNASYIFCVCLCICIIIENNEQMRGDFSIWPCIYVSLYPLQTLASIYASIDLASQLAIQLTC